MPRGEPRWIRCYDDGGDGDRYTAVFTGHWAGKPRNFYPYLGMSGAPFHPQGVCQHGESKSRPCDVTGNSRAGPGVGRKCHLGVRIRFTDLPKDCRTAVLDDYKAYWNSNEKEST